MVYLHRIYTRSGDAGETSLGDGTRVPKTDPRIVAYGGVDELNAVLGVALAGGLPDELAVSIRQVQNDLFDVGADLCVPETPTGSADGESTGRAPLRVTAQQVERLEGWIDRANERLEPLRSFILPGGTGAAAGLHHARTVCRRAEIGIRRLAESEPIGPHVLAYLNRLSDFLFVAARQCNDGGRSDVLWEPGQGQAEDP